MRPLSAIKPYENNPRLNDAAVDAAERTGRRAYLMELDPLYADVIVQRYEAFSGKKAERVAAGG
jgi:hypothetical protein